MNLVLTPHARKRSIQWNMSFEEISFIVQHAHRLHNAGTIFCQMRKKDMPEYISGNHPYWRLIGTTILLCRKCGRGVTTLYRNDEAIQKDRKKSKRCLRPEYGCCPYCSQDTH